MSTRTRSQPPASTLAADPRQHRLSEWLWNRVWNWLWHELRTTPARWPALGLAVTGVLSALTGSPHWVGRWNDTTLFAHLYGSIVVGIVSGIVAALIVGRSQSRGVAVLEKTGLRSGPAVVARSVLPVWVLAAGAFLLVLAAAAVRTVFVSGSGSPAWGVFVITLCLLAFQVAVGAFLGAWLPRWAAVVGTGVLLYGALVPVYLPDAERTWGRLYPVIQQRWDDDVVQHAARMFSAGAWLLAAAGLLLVAAGSRHRSTRPSGRTAVTALLLAGAAAAGVLLPQVARGQQWMSTAAAARLLQCAEHDSARVCGYSATRQDLEMLAAAFADLRRAGAELDFLPAQLVESGAPVAPGEPGAPAEIWDTSRDRTAAWSADPSGVIDRSRAVELVAAAIVPVVDQDCLRSELAARTDLDASRDIAATLTDRITSTVSRPDDTPAHDQLVHLPPNQQDAWMNQAVAAAAACRPLPRVPTP
ncbi:hypothetical protein [Terrabacter sp. 2RAF25]|uniref:hypothetical protein n=1 Tax=Terrabacter sp. 2RAF25 TaxID=3232998 RepID=UPI003F95954E